MVTNGQDGTLGDKGDVHYRCQHGAHRTCTIRKSMKSNLNSQDKSLLLLSKVIDTVFIVLINNLRVHVKPMYQLYCILKDHKEPPTLDEIAIASGKKVLDTCTEAEYLRKLEATSENIRKAFEDRLAHAAVGIQLNVLGLMLTD